MRTIATTAQDLRTLNQEEIDAVAGAATYNPQIGLSVETTKNLEQADRLQKAYISSNPFRYYGYFS